MPDGIEIEADEDAEKGEDLFSFLIEDQHVVAQLIAAVRSLLQRPELSPQTIAGIGVFLFALERLPIPTPGICATLSLDYELNQERDWISIEFENDRFLLGKGLHTYDPGVGGDTHSEIILEVGLGYREGDTFEAVSFAESFASCAEDACREVSIDQNADEPFDDWELPTDPGAWGRLDSEYI
jgi:hypothetical protein